jgi:hypothetical protein
VNVRLSIRGQQSREIVDVDRVCPNLISWQQHLQDEYPVDKTQQLAIPLFAEPPYPFAGGSGVRLPCAFTANLPCPASETAAHPALG